ncbi:hypothetical protein P0W64_02680 [Tsukamurella sp. 8F]|uniref:hypothetical protein n=1 Tax=unclassified Tsukamurella TaxID=2633480 RepID=UPI0023B9DEC7|nr:MULTISPECIES: hypothetical protein [unclassified Tsukamurella]MDF0528712.1 hypothetical protein [Tsukamurella sp. 8J]MDF0585674.1 hypothetical protein [Tsukamurella sp. 8F]
MPSPSEPAVFHRTDGGSTSVRSDLTGIGPLVIVDGHYPDDMPVDESPARCEIDDYDPRSVVADTGIVIRRESAPRFGTWERLDHWPE